MSVFIGQLLYGFSLHKYYAFCVFQSESSRLLIPLNKRDWNCVRLDYAQWQHKEVSILIT